MAETETREKLLESAKAEFTEKGFAKASLRTICKNAGVTTGAVYFFFKDKDDLFAEIVRKPLVELKALMQTHFDEDSEIVSSPDWIEKHNSFHEGRHGDFGAEVVHHIYSNYDAFRLLLMKSQGSAFENCIDSFVDEIEQSYRLMTENVATDKSRIDGYLLHWLSHMVVDAFVHLIEHEPNEDKAAEHIEKIMGFVIDGWIKLIFIPAADEK